MRRSADGDGGDGVGGGRHLTGTWKTILFLQFYQQILEFYLIELRLNTFLIQLFYQNLLKL